MDRTAVESPERALIEAIESTLFIYPAAHGLAQDLGIPGLRGRITKVSSPLANLVGDARLSDLETEAVIAKVKERYGRLAFGWVIGPSTRPADLGPRLEAAGLKHEESLAGMVLTDLSIPIPFDPATAVREATPPEAIAASDMMGRAYGVPGDVMRFFNELMSASASRIKWRGYFGIADERPVAWAVTVYLPDSPIVLLGGAATLPEHRGKGLYTALVARRVADARADGRGAAVIQAVRSTSAPICSHLGFREVCGLEMFASSGG